MTSPGSLDLVKNWQRAGFGIYVHWPFCAAKCPYCDFNSHVSATVDQDAWQNAYLSEIDRYAQELPGRVVTSVFFGGGTPSLMPPETIAAILDQIAARWTLSNDIEITLEANPTSTEASRFQGFRTAGVNRASVGVQALNDHDLKALGRLHSAAEALDAVQVARDTFDRVSFDLIYARQHQSLAEWQSELTTALSYAPNHLSLYQLTIEDGTAFGDRFRRGKLPGLPDEDLSADMYELTQDLCEKAGLPAYEVSNHAEPGQESRHNLIYWRGGDYLGIGPGAHGRLTIDGARLGTETRLAPSAWLKDAQNSRGESARTAISEGDTQTERLLMGLRLSEGLMFTKPMKDAVNLEKLADLQEDGFLTLERDQVVITRKGRPLLNTVIQELLA